MALTLTQKKEHVAELKEKFEKSDWCLLADPVGLTVAQVSELRKRLREKQVDYKIYKNTLIRRAIEESGKEELKPLIKHLKKPTGVAFTREDPIAAAKLFVDYAAENNKLEIKAAMLQGDLWDVAKTKDMSMMGSMACIFGQLAAVLLAPINELLYSLNGPAGELALTLEAVADKEKK